MAKPYSEDLRERLIAAVENGDLSWREAGRRYRVSAASAVRWVQQFREAGRTRARPMGGDRWSVLKPERAWLLRLIAQDKDLTLMALSAQLLAERGVKADASMLWRFFKAEGISFKKTVHTPPNSSGLTLLWLARNGGSNSKNLPCTVLSLSTRREPPPIWCAAMAEVRAVNGSSVTRQTAIGRPPPSSQGLQARASFSARCRCADEPSHLQYVRQFLVRELKPGDIVILDNLSSHKNADIQAAIAAQGATLLFLPPYSPDLNPIEMVFAKLKTLLRAAVERTRDDLWQRIGTLIEIFKSEECSNYIRHAGYVSA